VILVSNTFHSGSQPSRWHNPLSRGIGCVWLILAGWIFLTITTAVGVGIDISAPFAPWLLAALVMAVLVSIAGPWRPILILSALAGLVFAAFALSTLEGSTPDFQAGSWFLFAISVIVTLYSLAVVAVRR
jgi:hypothetical protein